MVDEAVVEKSIPTSDDDVVRSVRFRGPVWEKMLRLVEQFDRSPNWIVNKLVSEYGNEFPEPQRVEDPHGGVSTFMLQIEFQTEGIIDSDTNAYNVMAFVHDWLVQQTGVVASYPRIDHIGPMGYDPRFGYEQKFGYSKLDPRQPVKASDEPPIEPMVIG